MKVCEPIFNSISNIDYQNYFSKYKNWLSKRYKKGNHIYSGFLSLCRFLDSENISIEKVTIVDYDKFSTTVTNTLSVPLRNFLMQSYILLNDKRRFLNSSFNDNLFSSLRDRWFLSEINNIKRYDTVRAYRNHMKKLESYLGKNNIYFIDEITEDVMEEYVLWLYSLKSSQTGNSFSISYISSLIITATGFFSWLVKEDMIFYNPCRKIKVPGKKKMVLRNYLSEEQVKNYFKNFSTETLIEKSYKMILLLCYHCALRISEAIKISLADIDFESGILVVREGKGGKTASVPLSAFILRVLKEYLDGEYKRYFTNEKRYLFYSIRRKSYIPSATIRSYMAKHPVNMGEYQHVTPHTFRHSIAKHLLERGLSIRYVQRFLRHDDIDSTAIYTKLSFSDLRDVILKYHPREEQ